MKRLPRPKGIAFPILIGAWPLITIFTLVLCFATLAGTERFQLMVDLSKEQPSRLPRVFYYSLFAQKPPEGEVLGESVSLAEGREAHLKAYLSWQKSPMADSAGTFIKVADKYKLDWRLLPSIAGKESTFGKTIPHNSNNAFGWGVYGKQALKYESWDDAIEAVGKGLFKYAQESDVKTVGEIEYLYCPISAGSHHRWRDGVEYFMWEIETFPDF